MTSGHRLYLTVSVLALLLVSPPVVGQEVWTVLPTSPDASVSLLRHEDVMFADPDTGYVVNFDGELHRTTDGGITWMLVNLIETFTEEPVGLRSVGFADGRKGWIGSLSRGHALYETDDGGLTVRNISGRLGLPEPEGVCGLWVVNEEVVYGVGTYFGPARFMKTTNGGLSWTVTNLESYAGRLIDVFFLDEFHGFVTGGSTSDQDSRAVVLETRDGGETWTVRYESYEPGEWGWKFSFPTAETGYVAVERWRGGAKVLKTSDGGATWGESVIAGSRPLQGIGFLNETTGWVSGRGTTSMTTDGGLTWVPDTLSLDGVVNRFRFFSDTLAYAAGERVYKLRAGSPVSSQRDPVPESRHRLGPNYPNPFYPHTTFEYEIAESGHVRIQVRDLLGRLVRTIVDRRQTAGAHRAVWDGKDDRRGDMTAGVYLYSLETTDGFETRRMVLLRP